MASAFASTEDERAPWHALTPDEVVVAVASDASQGLTGAEARHRLSEVGPNTLREVQRRSLLSVIGGQLRSPLIYLLIAAALIALALGHETDAVVIAAVVAFNTAIGTLQEGRAERSLEALRRLTAHRARVVRDGHEAVVAARDLVPGDVLLLDAGDAIGADARVVEAAALQVAEAALTGESVAVTKDPRPVTADSALGDRSDMLHAGTHVTAGRARAIVVATGPATEIGHIATLAQNAGEAETPLEQRVAQFGRYVMVAAAVMFGIVVGVGYMREQPMSDVLMIAISQVVGMIPEGLPVAMTIALAIGVQRMARRHGIVRRLAAVETLGSTSVICTDKTGTLTKNEMTVVALVLPDGRRLAVTGVGYAPAGAVEHADAAGVRDLLEAIVLCNDAQLDGPDAEGRYHPIGDPTEVALLTVAHKAGLTPAVVRATSPRERELPFDPAAKMMATQHGGRVVIKGAPEAVLELCTDIDRARARRSADRIASEALRVLAVAAVDDATIDPDAGFEAFHGRAVLLGLVGEVDPPRAEVEEAIAQARLAGIQTVMVTGDHKGTGLAIARQLGIARDGDLAVDGHELEQMTAHDLDASIDKISVFARVHPEQKLRIVDAFQRRGDVVAMTGDGVNDAPALAKADVGVAMGITGTEVAKEASKVVIGDDNFATIVAAVEEGRIVYRNIKKVVLLLFSTSAAAVLLLMLALLLGYPPPLAAVQILWINLVTEGVVTINLIMDPAEGDEMQRPPISREEPLLTRVLLTRMAVMVPTIVAVTLGWFVWRHAQGVAAAQVGTETFTLLAICNWFNALNCRSERRSALTRDILRNRWLVGGLVVGNLLQVLVVFWTPLASVFHAVAFDLRVAVGLALAGSVVLWTEELRKFVVRRRERRPLRGRRRAAARISELRARAARGRRERRSPGSARR